MKTSLSLAFLFACLSLFAQTSSRPLRFYESIAAMVANRPITNEVLAVTQRSGTNAGPLLFFWHAPTSAPTNTVDTFNAIGGGQLRLITNVVTVAISDGSITTNKWDSVAHQWVSGKQDYSAVLAGLTNISYLLGDLLWWNGSALAAIHIGTTGQVLTVGTNQYYFATPSAGTGSSNASTNANQGWAAAFTNTANGLWIFNGAVNLNGTTTVADLNINAVSYSGVWPLINGGTGATTASDARTALGLVIGTDVQAADTDLLRIASVSWATGDFVYRDGTGLTNFASGTTGRSLLSAVTASDARSTIQSPNIAGDTFTGAVKVPMDAYNASTWTNSSKTNEVVTKGDIAAKLEALTVGGFITSVDATDLQVTGSQLSISNVIGTGRIVKESALTAGGITNTVQIDIYTNTSGTATWTKPAGAKLVEIYAIGGGGGGGSGRRGTNQHAGGGGGGGGGGAFFWTFSAADLGSTETVTVGTNGVGASGIAVDNTDGSYGTFGGASTVGTVAYATAGTGGGAGIGTGTGASSGNVAAQLRGSGGLAGAHGSNASIPTDVQDRIGGAAAGGGGGSITAAVVTNTPSRGGSVWSFVIIPGGAAGTSAGVNGTNGTAFGFTTIPRPGSGGGGGYPGFSSIGNGGNGGWPGGGGGGGAGCRNGTTSGSGGNGASGVVVIKTYF